jgi:predicted dehydrogenase
MILARRCHTKAVVRGRAWLNDEQTGGVLSYAGTHNIDLTCTLMGSRPKRVYCESGRLVLPKEQNFTDSAVMTFLFENGGIASLYESFAYPDSLPANVDRSIEVLGDRGALKIDLMDQPLKVYGEAGAPLGVDSVTWPLVGERIGGAIFEQARHFLSCIRNRTEVLTPGEDGLEAIKIAAAAREAARTGVAREIE